MNKPKILIISPFYPPNLGGVETHLQKLTDYLYSNSYSTTILTYKPLSVKVKYQKTETRTNLTIHRFWWFGLGIFDKTTPYPILQFLYIVPGLLLNSILFCLTHPQNFDVIHAHGFAAGFIARIIKIFFPNKKYVVSTHFIYHRLNPNSIYSKIFKWTFSCFDTILAVSQQSKQELVSVGLPSKKIKIFRYWVDQKFFTPGNKLKNRQLLSISSKYHLIAFFAGRFIKMKGIFQLLKVAKQVPKDILFLLAGDGPDAQKLKKLSYNVSNFKILGRLPHDQIVNYISASDLVILPSLSEEALPNIVIEALSCGRSIITTNKGSVVEMFDNSVGLSLNPTVSNLVKNIKHYYLHPKELEKKSLKAKAYALKNYGDKNAKVIVDSYYD